MTDLVAYTDDGDADDSYAAGDRTLDELTVDELADLERLGVEAGAVTDKTTALAFYDRLAGHGNG